MRAYDITINGKQVRVQLLRREHAEVTFEVEGTRYDVQIDPVLLQTQGRIPVQQNTTSSPRQSSATASSQKGGNVLYAPMPGLIVSVNVEVGQAVTSGQTVVVMEAMKMENNLAAPRSGVVKSVKVTKGQEVLQGAALIEIE